MHKMVSLLNQGQTRLRSVVFVIITLPSVTLAHIPRFERGLDASNQYLAHGMAERTKWVAMNTTLHCR